MQVLILGGTTEATALAAALAERAEVAPILSLAGRTARPATPPIPFRIGGFGGIAGLTSYLKRRNIQAVVDATHPFAARISANAVAACLQAKVPLARFTRPPWTPQPGDCWQRVPTLAAAAAALGRESRRVFLTTGRLDLSAFRQAPQHRYLLRTIDPPAEEDVPPQCDVLLARGPFDQAGEEALMRQHRVDVLVSKNSGGGAGRTKIDAARALDLPVVMVERPSAEPHGDEFTALAPVLAWIQAHGDAPSVRKAPSLREIP